MGETSTKKVFTDYFRNEKDIKVVAQKKKAVQIYSGNDRMTRTKEALVSFEDGMIQLNVTIGTSYV